MRELRQESSAKTITPDLEQVSVGPLGASTCVKVAEENKGILALWIRRCLAELTQGQKMLVSHSGDQNWNL